jgi:hypothetical protein
MGSYPISFVKNSGDDYTNALYQDKITDNVWFTRLNTGGPLFNYKYYIDNSIIPTKNILNDDFWYDVQNSQGGTIGVKWAILSSNGFPNVSAPGINTNLFGTIGTPNNFFTFSQMCTLLTAMINRQSKPVSLVDANNDNEWLLEDTNTATGTDMPYLENKDIGCYIPAINKYFKIIISSWGIGDNGNPGAITYSRTELYNPSNICFPGNTPIQTDQGIIMIEKINPDIHTIKNKPIIDITKTITSDKYLVCFTKNALGINYPTTTTVMSKYHKVQYKGKMIEAYKFIGKFKNVIKIKYNGEILYNVLMDKHSKMRVNNFICETLHPDNIIAKLYTRKCKFEDDVRDKIIILLNECIQNKDYKKYNQIIKCC